MSIRNMSIEMGQLYNRQRWKMVHIKTVVVDNKAAPRCGQPEAVAALIYMRYIAVVSAMQ